MIRAHTNSVNSRNSSSDLNKDETTDSTAGPPAPDLLELVGNLGSAQRAWVIERLGLIGFPLERVSAYQLSKLTLDDLRELRSMRPTDHKSVVRSETQVS